MNLEQYERWKDFAVRMAKTAFKNDRRPDAAWILERVEDAFSSLDFEPRWVEVIESWDHNADNTEHFSYVCDWLTDLCYEDSDHPGFWWIKRLKDGQRPTQRKGEDPDLWWQRRDAHEAEYDKRLDRWDEKYEDRDTMAHDRFEDDWYGPVRCCLRAGLDLACEPSAGVLGFTVGTLREMYPEGIPGWIADGFLDANESPADIRDCAPEVSIWL